MSRKVVSPIHFVWVREGARAETNRPLFPAKKADDSLGVRRFARRNGVRFAICAKDDGQGRRVLAGPNSLRLRKTKGDPFAGEQMCRMLIRPVLATEA